MFCLQEDIVQWLSGKTVKRVLSGRPAADDRAWERYQLAQYLRLHLAETFLAPGESVALPDWADFREVTFCGRNWFDSSSRFVCRLRAIVR